MQGPHTILSVGQDPTVLTHRHAILTRAGYTVTSAAQPLKALHHLLAKHAFDLVLVGTHGQREHVWIERIQKDKNVRVVFLATSNDQVHVAQEADVLQKVAEALSASLNRLQSGPASIDCSQITSS